MTTKALRVGTAVRITTASPTLNGKTGTIIEVRGEWALYRYLVDLDGKDHLPFKEHEVEVA